MGVTIIVRMRLYFCAYIYVCNIILLFIIFYNILYRQVRIWNTRRIAAIPQLRIPEFSLSAR